MVPGNLIGRGFIEDKSRDSVHDRLLPNLEDPDNLIDTWDDRPYPVGFGFYGRGWQPRMGYQGSEAGAEQADPVFGLPADFRPDFHNGAHPYLQVPGYLTGKEGVELRNLTPDGYRRFQLPGVQPVIRIRSYTDGPGPGESPGDDVSFVERPTREERIEAPLDTLVFLPDEEALYQVWRGIFLCLISASKESKMCIFNSRRSDRARRWCAAGRCRPGPQCISHAGLDEAGPFAYTFNPAAAAVQP